MTRWFPIAPGTTLPAAPAAVAGQITATRTVPVWNETVLIAARTTSRVAISSFNYSLSLPVINAAITTRTLNATARIKPISVGIANVALGVFTPSVSSGASVTVPVPNSALAALPPIVVSGASVAMPTIEIILAAKDPANAGLPRTVVEIPAANISTVALTPIVSSGASLGVPVLDLVVAAPTPAVGAYDPSFSSVTLLLHMNGSNDSTTFTDSSSNGVAVTANGGAKISTAQSKFGGASGYFDGTGDYLTLADSSLWDMPGDFTIEMWVRASTFGDIGGANRALIGFHTSALSASAPAVLLGLDGKLLWYTNTTLLTSSTALTTNAWAHVAYVRSGTTLTVYINGTSAGSASYSSSITPNTVNIGRSVSTAGDYSGYMDELRITKGVARYTSNFTPSSVPFPNQ